ncbi:MAG TPA: Ig-like domain-containing protein, partial [Longimicrobiales bacterium]|nr:Ig-like domain-containing protein [Longimicrobiales bacterium]
MNSRLGALRLLAFFTVVACSSDTSGPPKAKPPAAVAAVAGNGQTGVVGAKLTQALGVKVTDAQGNALPNIVVTFQVSAGNGTVAPASDSTNASGIAETFWTLGTSTTGTQEVRAQVSGVAAAATFTATANPGPPAQLQRINDVGCAIPGVGARDLIVKVTDSYGNPIAQTRVDWTVIGGGSVSDASSTSGANGEATTTWTIGSSGGQSVSAAVAGLTPTTFTALLTTARTVAVGASLTLTGNDLRCNDLASSSARYLISVANPAPDATQTSAFVMAGALVSNNNVVEAATANEVRLAVTTRLTQLPEPYERARKEAAARERLLQSNINLVRTMGALPAQQRMEAAAAAPAAPPPAVGEMLTVRMADVENLSCTTFLADIRARVVYSGTRAVVLEDSVAPLARTMDDTYRAVGQEFDNVMWPLLSNNFGDPLAMDAQLDNNQRIFMVFTKRVNDAAGGNLAGYVLSTDFYKRAECNASNEGEYFYARVPTVAGSGFNGDTRDNWLRRSRTVAMHELKHLASFAGRFFRAPNFHPLQSDFEQRWLEESSAMIAEELWARSVYGYAQRGNTDYRASVYCEVRPDPANWPECTGKPRTMFDHFFLLHDFLGGIETLSPLGSTSSDDFTWYGSGWSLLRHAIDHSSLSETAFLLALTNEPTLRGT